MDINWENFRYSPQGAIDLVAVFDDVRPPVTEQSTYIAARLFLLEVEDLSLIRSRQAAAIAIAYALGMLK